MALGWLGGGGWAAWLTFSWSAQFAGWSEVAGGTSIGTELTLTETRWEVV